MSDNDEDQQRDTKKKRRLNEQEKKEGEAVKDSYDKSKFNHVFSGLSIWLEFEGNGDLDDEMKDLKQACGGEEYGVHSFVPHVTILYNIDKKKEDASQMDSEATLKECWKKCIAKDDKVNNKEEDKGPIEKEEVSSHKLSACNWMYFHYPKSADNGKGFGCSISLLLIEKSAWLEKVHQVCADAFGNGDRDEFIPHLSLVYSPENREEQLIEYTEKQQKKGLFLKQPMTVKYLSLWSTEGRICDWRPILKIPV